MGSFRIASLLMGGGLLACTCYAHPRGLSRTPGSLVSVSVEVDGQPSCLYPAPDRSGRFYVEARRGGRYAVTLANRSGERLGVVLTVDGLNVISGERDDGRGRMYVLDPWQSSTVQGWRTSLQEVRRFTFVDERASYAARSGKANEKMGWIEVAVFRERRPYVREVPRIQAPGQPVPVEPFEGGLPGAPPPLPDAAGEGEAPAAKLESGDAQAPASAGAARSYPGTGWGQRTEDPVVLVSFDPAPNPTERITLRYEYRPALVALGVLPRSVPTRDRLWEREHAEAGFAQPPRW
jgi:hypothetical protein